MERRIRANDAAHNLQFNYSVNEAALLMLGTGRDWEKQTDWEGNEWQGAGQRERPAMRATAGNEQSRVDRILAGGTRRSGDSRHVPIRLAELMNRTEQTAAAAKKKGRKLLRAGIE